jgi:hypothetical protein
MLSKKDQVIELAVRIVLLTVFILLTIASLYYAGGELIKGHLIVGGVPFLLGLWMATKIKHVWKTLDTRALS